MRKEILVNPTLVVGVGGTGQHVAKMLRKMVEQDVHEDDRDRIPMRFVGIDTDLKDLNELSAEESPLHYYMPIAGKATHLGEDGDPREAAKLFARWLPRDRSGKLKVSPSHLKDGEGAMGRRLVGRYAFKYFAPGHFTAIQRQVDALCNLCNNPILPFKGIEYRASNKIEVFVVCSMVGGTGSGAFLDVLAMCHRLCEQTASQVSCKINLVLVTPSAFQNDVHPSNRQTHQATAYACLKDLDNLLNRDTPTLFEFFHHQSVEVAGPLANNVVLLGRHGGTGTVESLQELFRALAIHLYALIGTPIGSAQNSFNNNDTVSGQLDPNGGIRRYSSIGLVGFDFDQATRSYRLSNRAALGAVRRLRNGKKDERVADDVAIESILGPFLRGAGGPVLQVRERKGEDLRISDSTADQSPRGLAEELLRRSGTVRKDTVLVEFRERAKKLWYGSPREGLGGWRQEIEQKLEELVDSRGTASVVTVLSKLKDAIGAAKEDLVRSTLAPDLATSARAIGGRLESFGPLQNLFQKERVSDAKDEAQQEFNQLVDNLYRALAAQAVQEVVFGNSGGIDSVVGQVFDRVQAADSVLQLTEQRLKEQSEHGLAPDLTAMDRSRLIYDLLSDWPEDADRPVEGYGDQVQLEFVAESGGLFKSLDRLRESAGKPAHVALAENLVERARPGVESTADEHVLDLAFRAWPGNLFRENLGRILHNLTPLSHVDQSDPDQPLYDTTQALVPLGEDGDHPRLDEFDRAFRDLAANQQLNQAATLSHPGQTNRVLIALGVRGFALNDRAYPPLKQWRAQYESMRPNSPHLDVDVNWMREQGPGQRSSGSRSQVWTLGLAYGLIAQGKGNVYFNNIITKQSHDPKRKGTPEEWEVDAEGIMAAVRESPDGSALLARCCQLPAHQRLANRKLELATAFTVPERAVKEWHRRDRIAKGRAQAMDDFISDRSEDFADVETGIILLLEEYLKLMGKGTMLRELTDYRDRLSALRFAGEDMGAQIDVEIQMLNYTLDQLAEGRLGLPKPTGL